MQGKLSFVLGDYILEETEFTNVLRFYRSDEKPIGLEQQDKAWIMFCLVYKDVMDGFSNNFIFTCNEDGEGGLKLIVTTLEGKYPQFLVDRTYA